MNIANQGFPATRADLNNALQALATNNSGTSAPSTTFANQWWYDTTNNNLYIRNEANNAWILIASLDQTNNEWEIVTGVIQAKDSDGLALKTDDGTTRLFVKDSNGNIGIHNTTCSASLHVSEASSGLTARFSNEVNQTLDLGTVSGVNAGGSVYFDNANSGNILFRSGGNERMRMLAAGGLTFNGDTAAANALDDYEEGTWTPTFNFNTGASGVAYSERQGTYTKVGRKVTIMGVVVLSSKGSGGSGRVQITGVPFNCSTATGSNQYSGTVEARFVTLSSEAIHAEIGRSANNMVRIMRSQSGGQVVEITEANCANNTGFLFTITYEEA